MKNDEEKTEMILNYALEIIYMLAGEEYTVVKKSFLHRRHGHLLTGEVPVKCDDVAVYFTKDEWEYLQAHKDLYRNVVKADPQMFRDYRSSGSERIASPLHRRIGVPKMTMLTPHTRQRIIKRTRLSLPSSVQFGQLVHSMASIGRRVAKIDRNIYRMLREFKKQSALFPEDRFHVPSDLQNSLKESEGLCKDCQEPIYPSTENSATSFRPISCCQEVIDPVCKISAVSMPAIDSSPPHSPAITICSDVSDNSQTHSPCVTDFTGETLSGTPPPGPTGFYTAATSLAYTIPSDDTTSQISEKNLPYYDDFNSKNLNELEQDLPHPAGLLSPHTTSRLSHSPTSSNADSPNVRSPALIVVSEILEQQRAHMDSVRTPDCLGDPLPDIPLASMSAGLLNNFKMQSRDQPHRYAQLLFQHHVPYSVYKTWTHNTNFDGSRGKHALPKNLKKLIIRETSTAFKVTTAVLKKIRDTLNALLRIPRRAGWDSDANFV
uniref:KRAB domain-containing protein n=1 Tax=Leptobrachium leishanense TaxID=445787 RepID=A0A8C5QUS2_9ANUR